MYNKISLCVATKLLALAKVKVESWPPGEREPTREATRVPVPPPLPIWVVAEHVLTPVIARLCLWV